MEWSLVVSIIALVLSAGTVAWQLVREQWERPVVVVSGTQGSYTSVTDMATGDGESRWEYRIDVTNVGERAVTLIQVGLMTPRDETEDSYTTVGLLREEAEKFPIRLEPHDSRSWTVDGGPTRYKRGAYEPFVRLVQRPTWRERRGGILPERTIFGDWFGSYGPDRSGTVGRPRRKKTRFKESEPSKKFDRRIR